MDPDWLDFFASTIDAIHEPLSAVLASSGCREGWLQGELFRAGRRYDLRVNAYPLVGGGKADLSCGDGPSMVGEIKIVAATHFPKMRGRVEADVARLREAGTAETQRFMILVIPASDVRTRLGDWLHACRFSDRSLARDWPGFKLRTWQL